MLSLVSLPVALLVFLPIFHSCFFIFMDALSLISGRDLKFRAHTKAYASKSCTFANLYFFNLAFLQACSLPAMYSYKPLLLTTQTLSAKIKCIGDACTCIVQTYGGPEARRAIHLVIFKSCIFQNWIFFNFVLLQS